MNPSFSFLSFLRLRVLPIQAALCLSAVLWPAAQALSAPGTAPAPASLVYGGPNFRALATDSFRLSGLSGPFDPWMERAYQTAGVRLGSASTLTGALEARQTALRQASPAERDRLARETAVWAHTFIKKAIPKFSLERGFEFASIVKTGERQCLLQSVLIAGLLQRVGLDAGLEMVWKSQSGQESNLGHVTSVLRLAGGDLMVDASEPEPTARHQGVLAWAAGSYRFLEPVYGARDQITGYRRADGRGGVAARQVTFLSLGYVRSQFDYYRAERATGGVLGTGTGKATPQGLQTSERFLKAALKEEPQNALAAGVLGNVWRKQGREAEARTQYLNAGSLYAAQGHTPAGVQANVKWARGERIGLQPHPPASIQVRAQAPLRPEVWAVQLRTAAVR